MISVEKALELKWYAVRNDLIGGWSVSTSASPISELDHSRDIEVAAFVHPLYARHIARLHNETLSSVR